MVLLSTPFDPFQTRRVEPVCRSGAQAGIAAVALIAGGLALGKLGGALSDVGQGVASAAVHGGLLAAGWIIAVRRPIWQGPVISWAGALLLASVVSRFIAS